MKNYRDLDVWRKAIDLVVCSYEFTRKFPKNEIYGLSNQIQRSAVSIPANIAEGQSRQYLKKFIHHLSIAYGSLAELETHFEIAARLNYLSKQQLENIFIKTSEIARMLNGLRNSIKNKC
jgi:four helix bundle protein